MIYYDYLSTWTVKVGSSRWNFVKAFWNLFEVYCLAGFIVRLITGYGTNILWHLTMLERSAWVRVYPVEHYTPKMAKMSPAVT